MTSFELEKLASHYHYIISLQVRLYREPRPSEIFTVYRFPVAEKSVSTIQLHALHGFQNTSVFGLNRNTGNPE